jgi:hypothetical protein
MEVHCHGLRWPRKIQQQKKTKKQKASVNSAELSAQVSPTGSSFKKSAAAEQVNKQALDNALLIHFKRRIIENPYVPGHCFFEAMAISAELTKIAGSCLGAVINGIWFSR